ncbi:monooxygenase [Tieghemiomyces parasiticus]|uniref:Monooxygenase n=1 Tax=Tieghemiomyces parasiticus TaxID=78921 RepID=A0A9W8AC29_9FUNG|nr:monooxygenase [Tieghemiomyces parasiticus]
MSTPDPPFPSVYQRIDADPEAFRQQLQDHPYPWQRPVRRIAIVGAGPSGLCCAASFRAANHRARQAGREDVPFPTIQVFEQNHDVGGAWHYSDNVDASVTFPSIDPLGGPLPSAAPAVEDNRFVGNIYRNLQTNLPGDVMCFPGIPFDKDAPMFQHHPAVLRYLQDLARHWQVRDCIEFNARVEHLEWQSEGKMWRIRVARTAPVTTADTTVSDINPAISHSPPTRSAVRYETFDAVVMCNGHFNVPFVPLLPGLREVADRRLCELRHSRQYKEPSLARDKRVLVVGGGPSGQDMIREILPVAAHVYHSLSDPTPASNVPHLATHQPPGTPHANLDRVGALAGFDPAARTARFVDGTTIPLPDLVLFATGYLYSFPALAQLHSNNPGSPASCRYEPAATPPDAKDLEVLITDGRNVHQLFFQLFYMPNPTLTFPNIMTRVAPFPIAYYQAQLLACVYAGEAVLPDEPTMRAWYAEEVAGKEGKTRHLFGNTEVAYKDALADWVDDPQVLPRVPSSWAALRKQAFALRLQQLGY